MSCNDRNFAVDLARGWAAVPWTAQTRLTDGSTDNLAGVSVLRFGADGMVIAERGYWNQA